MPLNSLTRQLQPYFFCLLLCTNFNTMAAFLSTKRMPARKKSILAKVCFDAKKGWHVYEVK